MTLQEVIDELELKLLTNKTALDQEISPVGYASDLLSCVMAGASPQGVWVTLQSHLNIVAVASVKELRAVIITEGAAPDKDTIARANEEGIALLSTERNTFHVAGKLWELGFRAG